VFDYVRGLNKRKRELENGRLLYVAATRARQRLHLLGHVSIDKKGRAKPASNALLATLWPAVEAAYQHLTAPVQEPAAGPTADTPAIERLPADWQPPALTTPLPLPTQPVPPGNDAAIPFDWASETARHVGSLVHRYLEYIGRQGLAAWDEERIAALDAHLRTGLSALGVRDDVLDTAAARVAQALHQTLQDPRGRWLLEAHEQAVCEWALSGQSAGRVMHHVIDRSFIDAEGTRWIIDYKSGHHGGSDIEAFLDQEQARYRPQLETYARLVQQLGPQPIMLGLYFPLLQGWRCWSWPD